MIVDTVLTNAKAYLKREILDCNIAIEKGRIFKIGREAHMPKADETTNLRNLLVLPGLIDAHVHLRDEGKAYKEDFYTGTSAAAAGGVTTVLDMPNNDPVTMSVETLKNRMQTAKKKTVVNIGFYSEFPNNLEEAEGIVAEGALGLKLFMAQQIGGLNIDNDKAIQEAFTKTSELSIPVAVHAEDKATLLAAETKLKKTKHHNAAAFLKAHSEQVELKAIERLLKLNAKALTHLHFCHLTTKEGLQAITKAKKAGSTVTCEVTPNHLLLSSADFERYGALLTIMPPLRSSSHIESLWKGIAEGWVDTLGSDHAPHTLEEKVTNDIWEAKAGLPSVETTLPLMLTMARKNRLSIATLVQLLAERPAEIFGLNDRGKLEQGKKADLVAVDFNRKFMIDASKFHSKAKFSPYNGWEAQGMPVKTFVNGLLVMDEQEILVKPGSGELTRRGST